MRRSLVLAFAATAATAPLGACAANDESTATPLPPDLVPGEDAGDAASDAGDAAPCADCEDFPADCTADVLCQNGPFASSDPASNLDPRTEILVIRGRAADDVWIAGSVGALAHFDGTRWSRSDLGVQETMRALWLHDRGELALGTIRNIHSRGLAVDAGVSSGGWSPEPPPELPPGYDPQYQMLRTAWGPAGSDVAWLATVGAFGGVGLWRLRLSPPSLLELSPSMSQETCAILACSDIASIHGASRSTLWAVGGSGVAIRVTDAEGDAPAVKAFNTLTTRGLRGVWAASDTDAWAVGATGTIRHYRGDPMFWDVVDGVPTDKALNGVWGTSSSDIWAVGDKGVVLHYDGESWSRVKVAGLGSFRPNLYAVWSAAPGHVWVAGQGVVLSLGGKP